MYAKRAQEKEIVNATGSARYAGGVLDFSDSAALITVAAGSTATYTTE
jgi:hypothetical protein